MVDTLLAIMTVTIAALLAFIAHLIKRDIIDVRTSTVRREEMETVKVSMEAIVRSIETLRYAVEMHYTDVKENYVRRESINGHLVSIETKLQAMNDKIQLLKRDD